MRTVTILERGELICGGDVLGNAPAKLSRVGLEEHLYDRLQRWEERRVERGGKPIFAWGYRKCTVGAWVGVLQIPGLRLELLPKLDRGTAKEDTIRANLLEMLRVGGMVEVRETGLAQLSVHRGTLYDRLIAAFLERTLEELLRGLDRHYLSVEENLLTLRGKLHFARHITTNATQQHRFYCRHDLLSEHTPITTRLAQACRLLLRRGLRPSLATQCQKALALLEDVPLSAYVKGAPEPVFTRQSERFRPSYTFAKMLLEDQAAQPRGADEQTFSLLFQMEKVFERFIAGFYQRYVLSEGDDYRLYPQGRGQTRYLLRQQSPWRTNTLEMKPDLLFYPTRSGKNFIIDTKWKDLGKDPDVAQARAGRDDLYQLYAYVHRFECDRAVLLYPRFNDATGYTYNLLEGRDTVLEQRSIEVRFVNLSRDLQNREQRGALARELGAILPKALSRVESPSVA